MKILSLVFALSMLFVLTSCGSVEKCNGNRTYCERTMSIGLFGTTVFPETDKIK